MVVRILFYQGVAGQKIIIRNMTKKIDDKSIRNQKLLQIVDLLKFVLTLDDQEIVVSTIESVIESLEDEINK